MKYKSLVLFITSFFLLGCSRYTGKGYKASGFDAYNKQEILDEYELTLNSDLRTFPNQITSSEENTEYYAYVTKEFLDKDNTEIYLSCIYSEEQYNSEVDRLKNISVTIKNRNEEYTNNMLYDAESYNYPAYIATDGFGGVYEYALLKEDIHQIIYMYLYMPNKTQFEKYPDYIKKDTNVYNKTDTLKAFTIYSHSFDGGKSWIEYND